MANPDFLNRLGDEMGNVYAATSDRILINLARHFEKLDPDDLKPGGAFKYQAQKLAEFGMVTAETVEIIKDMMEGADKALRDCLEAAIIDALEDAEPELRRAAEAGLLNGGAVPPPVQPQLMQTFESYYRQSADKLNLVNTSMLESTENAYRETVADITNRLNRVQHILNNATGMVETGVESANTALRLAVDQMVKNGITGFVDHGGARWRPETYVAMDMRTTFHNTARAAFWERNEDYTNDLFLVSQHPGARPLCYPWQCKVISRYDLTREVQDGNGRPVHVYGLTETTYGEPAGLFGINCGHHPMCFIPGVSKVPELLQDETANAKQYAESQQQRAMERDLRQARLDLEVARARKDDKEEIKKRREAVREASDRLDEFCEETGRKRRREREYKPVNADWPNPDTYGESPTAVRDALRDWFEQGGGVF
jgi:hypothetical protein